MKTLIALFILVTLSACSSLTVEQQHAIAQKNHFYISDQKQYGKLDVWSASLKGDCEDYALYMRERLGGALLDVTTVTGEKHMVLQVGDMIIDNQFKKLYPRSKMTHKFVYQLTDKHVEQFLKARGKK